MSTGTKRLADAADGLVLAPKVKKFEEMQPKDLDNITVQITVAEWEWVQAKSILFSRFDRKLAKLQTRFHILCKDQIPAMQQWWDDNGAYNFNVKSKVIGAAVNTMEEVRDAAQAARNKQTASAAAWRQLYLLNLLISTYPNPSTPNSQRPGQFFADTETRFEEVIELLEKEAASLPPAAPAATDAPPAPKPPIDDHVMALCKPFEVDLTTVGAEWDRIQGIDGLKKQLENCVFFMKNTHVDYGGHTSKPQGILLHGPTGTGKTTLVEAFAKRFDLPLFSFGGHNKESLVGDTEKRIKELFEVAQARQPSVILMDEVDGLLEQPRAHETTLNDFQLALKLVWGNMLNLPDYQVFVFGTTSQPWVMAMDQFGRRFSEKVMVGLPDSGARRKVLQLETESWAPLQDSELDKLAKITDGYTAADMAIGVRKVRQSFMDMIPAASFFGKDLRQGEEVWVPVTLEEGERRDGLLSFRDLPAGAKVRSPLPSFRDFNQKFVPGLSSAQAKTVSEEDINRHKEWLKKWT